MRKINLIQSSLGIILIATMISGCSSSDERLAQFAQQSVETQRGQNEALARQSEAVVKESHALATAAGQLVSRDAEARRELLQAQSQLHDQLHQERSGVDRQRAELEAERRAIAQERLQAPIIAMAMERIGVLLACLMPLVLAAYTLRQVGQAKYQSAELGEFLLTDAISIEPRLLTRSDQARLPAASSDPSPLNRQEE